MPATRHQIRFVLNARDETLAEVGAGDSLLDYLRLNRRLTGTKEGCAEGDCGACTVLVGRLRADGGLVYEAVNACIRLLASLDGCHVVTVEHLAGANGELHPVQQAMLDHHASQCGFCTPGIVMSLYALWMDNPRPDVAAVEVALQGNLCRCTGYSPIIRAAMAASQTGGQGMDALIAHRAQMTARLAALRDGARVVVARGDDRAILPSDAADLAQVLADHPGATIVAGSTDVGLWVTKHLRNISPAVFIGHLTDLQGVHVDETGVTLGACVSYCDAAPAMTSAFAHLAAFWPRIGGAQVRNMGTVGGNIANGSPIGDTPPALIALGAVVHLRSVRGQRSVPLQDYFIAYGKQDRAVDEFVAAIHIPHLPANAYAAAYKITKRRDEDISAVAAGLMVQLDAGRITAARLAFGGMAATPKRAKSAEAALVGAPFARASFAAAAAALAQDFQPISDWRASAEYRALVAANLLLRFYDQASTEQGAVA